MTGWKHSASNAAALIEYLHCLRAHIMHDYPIRDILVLGMGGSALGARTYADHYAGELAHLGVRLRIVDTTEPIGVRAILCDLDPARCLVIVSSKSGGTIEPLCLAQIFFDHVARALGSEAAAARHFIAISDEGTVLSRLAEEQNWRAAIATPASIGGRYSALTAFGLAPIVLAGIAPHQLIESAIDAEMQCNAQRPHSEAYSLAQSMYQNLLDGRDKLVIGYSAETESFARWLEQLIAESLGKDGKGFIPLPMSQQRANQLTAYGCPDVQVLSFANMTTAELGAALVNWMFSTEALAQMLDVDPFDQPNVEAVKLATRGMLAASQAAGGTQNHMAQLLADPGIADAQHMPELVDPDSYIVILAWSPMNAETTASLERLAQSFEEYYQRPVVIAEGPHYLHASGQLYKGGPDKGVYVIVTQDLHDDLVIPGANYSLRQLYRAGFGGDIEVMLRLHKKLVKL